MVKLIIWVIVGLLALSFFGISLRALIDSPTNQDNIQLIWTMFSNGWHFIKLWLDGIILSVQNVTPH